MSQGILLNQALLLLLAYIHDFGMKQCNDTRAKGGWGFETRMSDTVYNMRTDCSTAILDGTFTGGKKTYGGVGGGARTSGIHINRHPSFDNTKS